MPNDLSHVRDLAGKDSLAVVTTTRSNGTIHASVVESRGVLEFPTPGGLRRLCPRPGAHEASAHARKRPGGGRVPLWPRPGSRWKARSGSWGRRTTSRTLVLLSSRGCSDGFTPPPVALTRTGTSSTG